jgi:O-methyltransferase
MKPNNGIDEAALQSAVHFQDSLRRLGRTIRAIGKFVTLADSRSRNLEAGIAARVHDLVVTGNTPRAVGIAGPARVKLFRDLGSDFLGQGREDLCIACRRAAVQLTPNDHVVHIELLRTLAHMNRWDEALKAAANFDLSYPSVPRHDLTAEEKVIYCVVADVAIASPELVTNLVRATDHVVKERIPGAIVECGVFRGGSALAMMLALRTRNEMTRDFYLYDTYAGMPVPDEVDAYSDGRSAREEWESKKTADGKSGWVVSTLEDTRRVIGTAGYPSEKTHYVEGLVEETIPDVAPDKIAILRLDTDFYRSTKHELEHLFPRLVDGGILLIDDYGAFRGSQLAVDEYFQSKGLIPYLHRVDANVRMIVK